MTSEEVARRPWQASWAGEEGSHLNADRAEVPARDPIADLISRLDAASTGCGMVPLLDGSAVQISRVAGGFAIAKRA